MNREDQAVFYNLDAQRRLATALVANARAVWELAETQLASASAEQLRVEQEIAAIQGRLKVEDYIV